MKNFLIFLLLIFGAQCFAQDYCVITLKNGKKYITDAEKLDSIGFSEIISVDSVENVNIKDIQQDSLISLLIEETRNHCDSIQIINGAVDSMAIVTKRIESNYTKHDSLIFLISEGQKNHCDSLSTLYSHIKSIENIKTTDDIVLKYTPTFINGYWNTSGVTPSQATGYYCISSIVPVKNGEKIRMHNWKLNPNGAAGYLYDNNKTPIGSRLNGYNFTLIDGVYEYVVSNNNASYIGLDHFGNSYGSAYYEIISNEMQIDKDLLKNYVRKEDLSVNNDRTIDLFIFMGQSNMAGRGSASQAPTLIDGAGYEFRAITDTTKLYPIVEPFGKNENVSGAINDYSSRTGSMVTSFANSYFQKTRVPIIGVSASVGGTNISQWQPDGALLTDAKNRLSMAVSYLQNNGYTIRHKFMVWCQGESDGDRNRSEVEYTTMFDAMFNSMKTSGIEKCFIVRIGKYNGTSARDYTTIINTQNDICKSNIDVIMVSTAFASFKEDGLMKDDWHYYQEAYNRVGDNAGANTAEYVIGRKEPIMFDPMTNGLYFSKWSY